MFRWINKLVRRESGHPAKQSPEPEDEISSNSGPSLFLDANDLLKEMLEDEQFAAHLTPETRDALASLIDSNSSIVLDVGELAKMLMSDSVLMDQLPSDTRDALRGLDSPQATEEQISHGLTAMASIVAAWSGSKSDRSSSLMNSLRAWYAIPTWQASRIWLASHLDELPAEAPALFDSAAEHAHAKGNEAAATTLAMHARLLREARRVGVEPAYRSLIGNDAFDTEESAQLDERSAMRAHLEAWINASSWLSSRLQLEEHASELLTDDAETLLASLYLKQTDDRIKQIVSVRQQLLHDARRVGIEAAYTMRAFRSRAEYRGVSAQLLAQWAAWLATPDWNASRSYLREHASELLTRDAEDALELPARAQLDQSAQRTEQAHWQLLRHARLFGVNAAYEEAGLLKSREFINLDTEDTEVTRLVSQAHAHDHAGDFSEAEKALQRILEVDDERQMLSPIQRATVLAQLGNAFGQHGTRTSGKQGFDLLERAVTAYRKSLALAAQAGQETSTLTYAGTYLGLATTLQLMANRLTGTTALKTFDQAIALYREAISGLDVHTDSADFASLHLNLGNMLRSKAELLSGADSIDLVKQAGTEYRSGVKAIDKRDRILTYCRLKLGLGNIQATLADRVGGRDSSNNVLEALREYADGLAVLDAKEKVHALDYARLQIVVGNAYVMLMQHTSGGEQTELAKRALDAYRAVLHVLDQNEAASLHIGAWIGIGNVLRLEANTLHGSNKLAVLEQAEEAYQRLLQLVGPNTEIVATAGAYLGLGQILEARANLVEGDAAQAAMAQAIAAYQSALDAFPCELQPYDHRRVAHSLAGAQLRYALASQESVRAKTLSAAQKILESAQIATDLLELRAPTLSLRQSEWSESAQVASLAACVAALSGSHREAIRLYERGRARFLAQVAGRRAMNLAVLAPHERRRYESALQSVLELEARSRQESDLTSLVTEARAANERLAGVVEQLHMTHPEFVQAAQDRDSAQALTASLLPREALVYLIPEDLGTLILALPYSGEPRSIWLSTLTASRISAMVASYNDDESRWHGLLPAALSLPTSQPLQTLLDELLPDLGDNLMSHVVAFIRTLTCERAVLIPGGSLGVLPLHAAAYHPLAGEPPSCPGGRRYACDDLILTYAPSGGVVVDTRRRAAAAESVPPRTLFAVGNPQLTRKGEPWTRLDHGYLRYAEWEAEQVGSIARLRAPALTVEVKTNEQATWQTVVDGLRRADIAHLALHAFFDIGRPEASGLLVAPQARLFLRDLIDSRLLMLSRLRLIVISACQSALSDWREQPGEAVGLFGALLAAGAPSVIGTLWRVSDLAAATLMESFARRYLLKGEAPDVALRAAARELRGLPDEVVGHRGIEQQGIDSEPRVSENAPRRLDTHEPGSTSAQRRWAELAAGMPDTSSDARLLSQQQFEALAEDVGAFRVTGSDHPVHWAAFVLYGATYPLSTQIEGLESELGVSSRRGSISMGDKSEEWNEETLADVEQRAELPTAEERAPGYYPPAKETCPRCNAVDYTPVGDELGRDVRECDSCHLRYLPSESIVRGGS